MCSALKGSQRYFPYFDDAEMYLEELSLEQAAKVVSYMDADDALDVLDDLSESKKNAIVSHLDADAQKDVQKLLSYEEDEIGSCMTNNFVCISEKLSVREAMSELVRQAGEHDNISTIYVTDEEEKVCRCDRSERSDHCKRKHTFAGNHKQFLSICV